MSKTWSKEDRHHFEKSEVMQGLETIVLDTIRRADILQEKFANADKINAVTEATSKLKAEIKETGEALTEAGLSGAAADDGAIDESCDGHTDHVSDEVAEDGLAEDHLQDEVIDDLRDLVAAAISEGNIKLAYRIERTIDEIMEQDTPCI
jgi:hypothetical protein